MPHEKNVWDIYICLLLVWVCFGTPVVICFGLDSKFWKGHPLGSEFRHEGHWVQGDVSLCAGSRSQPLVQATGSQHEQTSWFANVNCITNMYAHLPLACLCVFPCAVVQLIVDLSFLTDMYLNFRTAYIDKRGNLVTNRRRIAKAYLSKWLLPDLISVLPLHFFLGSWSELTTLIKLLRVVSVASCKCMWQHTSLHQCTCLLGVPPSPIDHVGERCPCLQIRFAKILRLFKAYRSQQGQRMPLLIEWFEMRLDKSLLSVFIAISSGGADCEK